MVLEADRNGIGMLYSTFCCSSSYFSLGICLLGSGFVIRKTQSVMYGGRNIFV